jgi:hypothetical protein
MTQIMNSSVGQRVGLFLTAATFASGLTLVAAPTVTAQPLDPRTTSSYDFFQNCVKNRGKGSGYECCLAAKGKIITDNSGNYLACSLHRSGTVLGPSGDTTTVVAPTPLPQNTQIAPPPS